MTLSFPVLRIAPSGTLRGYRSLEELESCTPRALRERYFEGSQLVDSDGIVSAITNAERVGRVGGFHLLKPTRLRVKLTLEQVSSTSLDELKHRVAEEMSRQQEFWESEPGIDELRRRVRDAASFRELIDCFVSDWPF